MLIVVDSGCNDRYKIIYTESVGGEVHVAEPNVNSERQQVHFLLDALPDEKISAVRNLLEVMVDPVDRAIANAPVEDERISEEEERAVAASIAWLVEHPGEGTSLEDMMAEFGLSSEAKEQRQGAA